MTTIAEPIRAEVVESDSTLARTVRGVAGGEIAGAVFALLTVWFTASLDEGRDAALLMISTIATGRNSVENGTASVAVGVLIHLALSASYGVIFSRFVPRMHTNGTLLLCGGIYGLAVYVVNFRILSPLLFPAFQHANQPFEVLVHLVYGQVLALIFLSRGVRSAEPRIDWQ